MEGSLAEAEGSISQTTSQVKDEPQSRVKCDPTIKLEPDSSHPTLEVKTEQKESESKEETTTAVKQEERTPEPDSEDSLTAERVAEMMHRLSDIQGHGVSAHAQPETGEEATPPRIAPSERTFVSEDFREPGAVIRNQEAKKVRDVGSLIFETPIQHDYEEGVEVRSLLPSEQLEEMDGRLAVIDVSPTSGARTLL